MKIVGDTIHVQQGEIWSLDFRLVTEAGHPFLIPRVWRNPFLVMTVTRNTYAQTDDFKEVHWLDLKNRWIENNDGSMTLGETKRFTYTEPLYLDSDEFPTDWEDILEAYPNLTDDANSESFGANFLFYIDPDKDGNYRYAYLSENFSSSKLLWIEGVSQTQNYDFRIIKQFDTKEWSAGTYFFDIKIVDGDISVEGAEEPLAAGYTTQMIIQYPTTLYVGTNIQGGI